MNYDLLGSVIFIIFAVLMAFQSIQLDIGRSGDPAPGFLPLCSSLCIGLLSLGQLVSQIRKVNKEKKIEFNLGPFWRKAFLLVVACFFYTSLLWDRLGYVISTGLWLVSILWIGEIRSWKKIGMIAIPLTIISYFLFERVAKLPLPKGVFGF